jgi:ribonucleoside-diphosphate reductase alpha chain
MRRNGAVSDFDSTKIGTALMKAFLAVEGGEAGASARVRETVERLTAQVVHGVSRDVGAVGTVHIEAIQDQVELALMRAGEHKVARAYVLYREAHAVERDATGRGAAAATEPVIHVTLEAGGFAPLDRERLRGLIDEACNALDGVSSARVLTDTLANLYDGITEAELSRALVLASRALVEVEPNYTYVAARLLLDSLRREALGFIGLDEVRGTREDMARGYAGYFKAYVATGIDCERLTPELAKFDLDRLAQALDGTRDDQFNYLGLQTLYDRYFIHADGVRFELPQAFFMRVAMGLAINETEREARAIEFYDLLSRFDFMSSTPTLFNSATLRPQLSSCYLTTVADDLSAIYGSIRDNALLSKFAGGLGNDWTGVRALDAPIRGTNGKSQGVVPFLKVANDTAVAVNQGGKRKGAVCAYLETWHKDIEEFLELRKNTGDERRRTHDMNTANWIPDLFMKRVIDEADWTLFSPDDVPDLHDLSGRAFDKAYRRHETRAANGDIANFKTIKAVDLWRKMLGLLFETGHPWLTFKDACNLRSPQSHAGVVHSSNLCTEITLNTSADEIAVCNLGSVNLAAHLKADANGALQLDADKLRATVTTAMRMLDNVIDYNYYAVDQARDSNARHRPVGLGIMGFQDALYQLRLPYESAAAVAFADRSMERVSYYAIEASTRLAEERGRYASFDGSLWSRGVLPIDSIDILERERGAEYLDVNRETHLDWNALRERVKSSGMRHSNCMAIAPTATIANIVGVSQSIEPTYQNLYVKANLSGDFTVINPYLAADLKARDLWDEVMVNDLKYFDGSVQAIDRVPAELKALYKGVFEIDPNWLVAAAARRQKWLDQSQSLNLYMAEPSGPKLDALYKSAWRQGLKTTYYLRGMGASHAEKTTIEDGRLNATPKACAIDDPECEACQ